MENNKPLTIEEIEKRIDLLHQEKQDLIEMRNDLIREQRVAYLKQLVGMCYKAENVKSGAFKNYCSCLMVYAIDEKRLKTKSISINYWDNEPDFIPEHFAIEHTNDFDPGNEDMGRWKEITKQEFDMHYQEVESRINAARGIHTILC